MVNDSPVVNPCHKLNKRTSLSVDQVTGTIFNFVILLSSSKTRKKLIPNIFHQGLIDGSVHALLMVKISNFGCADAQPFLFVYALFHTTFGKYKTMKLIASAGSHGLKGKILFEPLDKKH